MKISNLRKENHDRQAILVADIESVKFGKNTIWASVPIEYENYLTTNRYDGFLVALIYPAMAYREDIEVDGTVSKRLLRNINTFIQDILMAYNSELYKITITAKDTTNEIIQTAKHIGTGFSGGIDSFSTIYDNYVLESDPEYKIDTFVFLNVGSHGKYYEEKTKVLFQNRYNYLKKYTDTINLPFIPIDTNIHYYYQEWMHLLTLTLNLTAGILLLEKIFKKYYVASPGYNYSQWIDIASKKRNKSLAPFAEPYLLPLLSTETTEFIPDGTQHTRLQKTINIINYPLTKQFLDVCWYDEPQKKGCGICPKCARVGQTLSIIGKLDDYKDVLNIEKYKESELRLKCRAVLGYKIDPFMYDIVNYAEQNGKKYPSYLGVYAHLFILKIKTIAGRILRRK